jgi:hypothetical protein
VGIIDEPLERQSRASGDAVGLELGPLSLVTTIEELLEWKSVFGLENRE